MSKNGSKIQSRIQDLKSKSDSMEKLAFDGFQLFTNSTIILIGQNNLKTGLYKLTDCNKTGNN